MEWAGDYVEKNKNEDGSCSNVLLAFDALMHPMAGFHNDVFATLTNLAQYDKKLIDRELVKAYAAFLDTESKCPIATGNWYLLINNIFPSH